MLLVENLTIYHQNQEEPLVRNISFSLAAQESLGIVGESGSGKTMICKALMGLLTPDFKVSGRISYEGKEILPYTEKQLQTIRGTGMTMIMQNAQSAFNPLLSMKKQFQDTFCQKLALSKEAAYQKAVHVLELVNIKAPKDVLEQYPHQLSGGMLQRCMIAMAIALEPNLILADEPTTALDALSQKAVIEQLQLLRDLTKTSLIFVSHDLSTVQQLTDKVLVLQKGICVEQGDLHEIFNHPQHTYTQYLVNTHLEMSQNWQTLQKGLQSDDSH